MEYIIETLTAGGDPDEQRTVSYSKDEFFYAYDQENAFMRLMSSVETHQNLS